MIRNQKGNRRSRSSSTKELLTIAKIKILDPSIFPALCQLMSLMRSNQKISSNTLSKCIDKAVRRNIKLPLLGGVAVLG